MTDKIERVWVMYTLENPVAFASEAEAMLAKSLMGACGFQEIEIKAMPIFYPPKPKSRPRGSRNKVHGGSARKAETESAPAMSAASAAAPASDGGKLGTVAGASDPFDLGEFKRT